MELDMPQLRQMVLENTERINRNELMINMMRMKTVEQTRKISKRDEWLENFRRENDRSMRESKERMDRLEKFAETSRIEYEKRSQELNEQMKKRDEAFEKRMKESDEKFDREMKESREAFEKRMKESEEAFEKRMKESEEKFNRQLNEEYAKTNESIRRISTEFIGVTGHMVEGLIGSSAEKIFQEAGFDLHDRGKNLVRVLAPGNRQMEVDAMLGNESVVVPVEVKEHFTKKKVKRFLHKMEMFREFFPECADKEVLAAVAAINYEAGADALAYDEGLLVIRVSSDDIFSLDPVDKKKLRRF